MLIDCDSCEARDIACDDCVVSVLLGTPQLRPEAQPYASVLPVGAASAPAGLELHEDERAAIEVLARAGLVPPLRLAQGGPGEGPPSPSHHAV